MKKRIDHLQQEIEAVRAHRETQPKARLCSEIKVFAIVGYTNAGKFTLLKALTDAEVLLRQSFGNTRHNNT